MDPPTNSSNPVSIDNSTIIQQLKKLTQQFRPDPSQAYLVWIKLLTKEVSSDGEHGIFYVVGTYPRADQALEIAQKIVEKTGIPNVYVEPTGTINTLQQSDPNARKGVIDPKTPQKNKRIVDQMAAVQEDLFRQAEEDQLFSITRKTTINGEKGARNKVGSLEYYAHLWYRTLTLKAHLNQQEETAGKISKKITSLSEEITQLDEKNPDYQKKWLPHYRQYCEKTGETSLYEKLKFQYEEYLEKKSS